MPDNSATGGTGVSLLKIAAVKARVGLGRSSIYNLVQAGRFPAPVHVAGTRVALWPSDRIDAWIAAQLAETEEASHA